MYYLIYYALPDVLLIILYIVYYLNIIHNSNRTHQLCGHYMKYYY